MRAASFSKSTRIALLPILLLLAVALGCSKGNREEPQHLTPIKVGWNTTWATEGQIIQCLKHTNILELYGLQGDFKGFTYGGPLSEAALASQVDVLSAADQPTINLLARGAPWTIIARSIVFRDALLSPQHSTARTLADLKGKRVAIPFGSGAHRVFLEALTHAGLKPGIDVTLVNLDITEINALVQTGESTATEWKGGIAAVTSWDPHIATFSGMGKARVLYEARLLGLRTMSKDFIQRNPEVPVRFLKAVAVATLFYNKNRDLANRWFMEDARASYSAAVLDSSAAIDPNTRADRIANLNLGMSQAEIATLQSGSDFAYAQGMIKANPQMSQFVDLKHLDQAMTELRQEAPDLAQVKVRDSNK